MILEAKNISVDLGDRRILDDVSLSSRPGQLIGLIGPNGAGKSTLLRTMAGLLKPSRGELRLGGNDMLEMSAIARAHQLAYMPQDHTINWPISVYDLVAIGRLPFQHPLSSLNDTSKAAIKVALTAMSVEHLAHRAANELSGGELARVLLARALAQTPQILLADEPTAGLDPAHKLNLLNYLSKVSHEGMSVILVLHDLTMAARFCDHLVLLNKGRIYDIGKPEKVLTHKALGEVYHIKAHIDRAGGWPIIIPLDVEDEL